MIEYIEGDIFESPAQVIVNTVNTVGVMGKGLALAFKKRYPDMFERYKQACDNNSLTIGKLMLFYEADHWLLLFPTKEHWRNPSKLEYIEAGLQKFVRAYADKSITSVAFPRLGCGNGGLDWEEVRPLMERYLSPLPIDIYIYVGNYPDPTPEHKEPEKTMAWLKQHAKDMSFYGLRDGLQHKSGLLGHGFDWGGKKCQMQYAGSVLRLTDGADGSVHEFEENELRQIWYELVETPIVRNSECDAKRALFYALLFSEGYLSPIRSCTSTAPQMQEGYQLNQGLGRIYSFQPV